VWAACKAAETVTSAAAGALGFANIYAAFARDLKDGTRLALTFATRSVRRLKCAAIFTRAVAVFSLVRTVTAG
jgi:hypothetical protein